MIQDSIIFNNGNDNFTLKPMQCNDDFNSYQDLFKANDCMITIGKENNDETIRKIGEDYVENTYKEDLASFKEMEKVFHKDNLGKFWVLIDNSKNIIIGSIALEVKSETEGELRRMVISHNYRRRGLGFKLINHLLNYTKAINLKRIYLKTPTMNTPGVKMYKKANFKIESEENVIISSDYTLILSVMSFINKDNNYILPIDIDAFQKSDLVELITLSPSIKLDIRYATDNNFLSKSVYKQARAFLQKSAALSLLNAHNEFITLGYGCMIYDGYRPWSVTCDMWDNTCEELKDFVANPQEGSKHNRGCAVDLTLYSLTNNLAIDMPGEFDEFSDRSSPNYNKGTINSRNNRDLLRKIMEKHDFTVDVNEWWHFNWINWKEYPIENISFDEINLK
jgi:D-alanyl-D-alanine dipeptidase